MRVAIQLEAVLLSSLPRALLQHSDIISSSERVDVSAVIGVRGCLGNLNAHHKLRPATNLFVASSLYHTAVVFLSRRLLS
jgi:hypothetical protein